MWVIVSINTRFFIYLPEFGDSFYYHHVYCVNTNKICLAEFTTNQLLSRFALNFAC